MLVVRLYKKERPVDGAESLPHYRVHTNQWVGDFPAIMLAVALLLAGLAGWPAQLGATVPYRVVYSLPGLELDRFPFSSTARSSGQQRRLLLL